MSRVVEYLFGMTEQVTHEAAMAAVSLWAMDWSTNAHPEAQRDGRDLLRAYIAQQQASESASRSTVGSRDWIPVTERLPEPRTQVLFAAGDGEVGDVVCVGFLTDHTAREWVDLESDSRGYNFMHPAEEVTHWRELPEPPADSTRTELGECPEGEPDNDQLDFGCCPGDSAALLKLRQAIDDAGAWPSEETREAGDYEAAVSFMASRLTEQQAEHERVVAELTAQTWRLGTRGDEAEEERDALKHRVEALERFSEALLGDSKELVSSLQRDTVLSGRLLVLASGIARSVLPAQPSASSASSGDIEAEAAKTAASVGSKGDCVGHLMAGCTCADCLRARGIVPELVDANPSGFIQSKPATGGTERCESVSPVGWRCELKRGHDGAHGSSEGDTRKVTLFLEPAEFSDLPWCPCCGCGGGPGRYAHLASCPKAADTAETEQHHELNAATFCVRCKRFDPSGVCPGEAAGGTERCRAARKNPAGSLVQCTHKRNHLGVHEGVGVAWPNQAEDHNGWADKPDPTPSPALPVGQGEDSTLSDSLRLVRHFLDDKEQGTAECAWLAARELLNWAEELERKGGK